VWRLRSLSLPAAAAGIPVVGNATTLLLEIKRKIAEAPTL